MAYNISFRVFFSFSPSFLSMATTNQSVRTCVLKVDAKCCSGCQNQVKTKLLRFPGVSAVEYNEVKGLMTVTGDVDPMTLVQKLTKCKKTELVSVNYMPDVDLISDEEYEDDTSSDDTSSNHDSRPMERASQVNMRPIIKKKEGMLRKYLLLGCLRRKPKVIQPFPLAKRMFGSTRFGNGGSDHGGGGGYGNHLGNARRPPPPPFQGPMRPQQQYQMMMQQRQPQLQMSGAPMQMQSGPPQNVPYHWQMDPQYKAMFPPQVQQPKPDPKMLVNNGIHYSGK